MLPAEVDCALARARAELFGFEALRPGQAEVIDDVMAGRPAVVVMPTGAGKSLCYQLPAVVLGAAGGVTLVISPLIALMKDQVDGLRARGVPATALTSASSSAEQYDLLAGIRTGQYALVYVAPERFRSPRFIEALSELGDRLALLAIDEAHCISEWGHDFRPDYRRLGEVVASLTPPRLVALTATATPQVRRDIVEQLRLPEARLHVRGFDRPNLHYEVRPAGGARDKAEALVRSVRHRTCRSALIYAATRKNAERYAAELGAAGMRVRAYHAGLDDATRTAAQDDFMADRLDAIVATNAFGMGIDKPDIHLVIHADLPGSVEAYYQESGRGGRDGQRTECVLLFNHSDTRLQEFLIDASNPGPDVLRAAWKLLREQPELGRDDEALRLRLPGPPHAAALAAALRLLVRHGYARDQGGILLATMPDQLGGDFAPLDADALQRRADMERRKLRHMVEYAYCPRCRRQFMLDYFGDGEWTAPEAGCAACDNCAQRAHANPLTGAQRMQAAALLRLVQQVDGRYGRTRIAKLANGSEDDPRLSWVSERGALRGHAQSYAMDLLRALEGAGLIEASRGDYPTLSLSAEGAEALRHPDALEGLRVLIPQRRASRARTRTREDSARVRTSISDDAGDLDPDLIDRLRSLRTELARDRGVPPYVVYSNATLLEIARARPATPHELGAVPGIGPHRLESYGERILESLRRA